MNAATGERQRRVWDLLVRVFHWTLVACVLLDSFVADDGEDLHHWLGYLAAARRAACARLADAAA